MFPGSLYNQKNAGSFQFDMGLNLGPVFSVCINYICAVSYIIVRVLASNHKARERRLLHDADWFVGVVLDINRYIMTSLVEKRQQCTDKLAII